ncbi:restriction endonuclease subunit S [Lonepinella koalarum]|uniref:restriction endonuclease subunit S n=1 Tax=Lonepinella koalarum TaxID=53417 RepID=UPI003F6DC289
MSEKNNNVPAIRFAGFTDAWERRKLGDIAERITRKNGDLSVTLPLTISAQEGLIAQTEFFDKQVASKNISNYYIIENGEFAYNKSYSNGYPFGAIKRLDNYNNGVLSVLYIIFKPKDIYSQFLVSYFDSNYWHSEVASIAVEGARNHGLLNISSNDFFDIKLNIPKSLEEQTQIGNFFKQLDDTIANHQRELEKYKNLKTSYLEKMFPKENEAFPELRFPNFTDAWERRKLGDVVKDVSGNDGRTDLPILTISASLGWLEQKERFSQVIAGNQLQNYTLLRKGELSYNHGNSKLAKYGVVIELKDLNEALVPKVYHSIKCSKYANPTFLEYLFWSKIPDGELGKLISSSARMDGLLNISKQAFLGINITIPSVIEQTQIGNFFKQLDDTIANHQRELEKYQKIKLAYLEKMFV